MNGEREKGEVKGRIRIERSREERKIYRIEK